MSLNMSLNHKSVSKLITISAIVCSVALFMMPPATLRAQTNNTCTEYGIYRQTIDDSLNRRWVGDWGSSYESQDQQYNLESTPNLPIDLDRRSERDLICQEIGYSTYFRAKGSSFTFLRRETPGIEYDFSCFYNKDQDFDSVSWYNGNGVWSGWYSSQALANGRYEKRGWHNNTDNDPDTFDTRPSGYGRLTPSGSCWGEEIPF